MIAVFNDCNMAASVDNAESPFVPYDKVIWYLCVIFRLKFLEMLVVMNLLF